MFDSVKDLFPSGNIKDGGSYPVFPKAPSKTLVKIYGSHIHLKFT